MVLLRLGLNWGSTLDYTSFGLSLWDLSFGYLLDLDLVGFGM
jgi:hypothetical protein